MGPIREGTSTFMVPYTHWSDKTQAQAEAAPANGDNQVVLMVLDHVEARPELKKVLRLSGYQVIDADNGREAARQARQTHPDLLVVDMDVPLLYGLVAARQIIKLAQVGPMPVVIVTHDDVVDPAPMMEVGISRNEYVTRLSDYEELQHLLDYLLPVLASTNGGAESSPTRFESTRLPLYGASAPEPHPHPDVEPEKPNPKLGDPVHQTSKYKLL